MIKYLQVHSSNKDLLTITSICLYASHTKSNATANSPCNKSVKVPFTHDVQKRDSAGMGSHVNYVQHFALPHAVFPI